MDKLLSERFEQEMDGVLNCYDRIVITGNLQTLCDAQGLTQYLYQKGIRIFDYAKFAEPFRERICQNAEKETEKNGIKIEFIHKKDFRKEGRVQELLKTRSKFPCLVHISGAMEACNS